MRCILVVVFLIIICATATLGSHLLIPEKYHWLDREAISQVKDAVLSGVAVALGTTYLRRYMGNKP